VSNGVANCRRNTTSSDLGFATLPVKVRGDSVGAEFEILAAFLERISQRGILRDILSASTLVNWKTNISVMPIEKRPRIWGQTITVCCNLSQPGFCTPRKEMEEGGHSASGRRARALLSHLGTSYKECWVLGSASYTNVNCRRMHQTWHLQILLAIFLIHTIGATAQSAILWTTGACITNKRKPAPGYVHKVLYIYVCIKNQILLHSRNRILSWYTLIDSWTSFIAKLITFWISDLSGCAPRSFTLIQLTRIASLPCRLPDFGGACFGLITSSCQCICGAAAVMAVHGIWTHASNKKCVFGGWISSCCWCKVLYWSWFRIHAT